MKNIFLYFIFIITLFKATMTFGQLSYEEVKNKFDELSKIEKGLDGTMESSVSQISLFDFITAIGIEHKLNVSVDAELNQIIINNFHNVKVKDALLFLIKKYKIDVSFVENIISFNKPKKKEKPKKKYTPKLVDINYVKNNNYLSVKVEKDTLFYVAKAITDISGKNIVVAPNVKNKIITSYILNKPFDQVIEMLAKSNKLIVTKDENDFYFIEENATPAPPKTTKKVRNGKNGQLDNKIISHDAVGLIIDLTSDNKFNIKADNTPVIDVIYNASLKSKDHYFLYNDIDKSLKTSFFMESLSFENLLVHIFKGTDYTFKKKDNYFLIGKKDTEGLRTTEFIQLENRTIENVLNSIPSRITSELELKEFVELNGIIASGHHSAIEELKEFISKIDINVPMIQIEVLIVQYNKSYDFQTGIQAGIADLPVQSTLQNLHPTTDVTINSNQVNQIIDAFNGLGIFNLGKVTQNFYLSLKALENNSIINLESTPKISTLNGHEATFTIGATDYYFEQSNRLITQGVNNNVLQSGQWKPTEANLSLRIKPFVSKDEDVTLEISVEKSAFTGRSGEDAPPGKTTQQFESLVRVKNGEMILLGGLDEAEKSNAGTGTPFLSRIPIIKWFFSSRKKKKSKSKLHIFIKPTVYFQ